jgi:hypothetical protein
LISGALGKRTFFQVKELAQLTLKVDKINLSESSSLSLPVDVNKALPTVSSALQSLFIDNKCVSVFKDLTLDDDLRLPQINFSVKDEGKYPILTPVEQCVVLASL